MEKQSDYRCMLAPGLRDATRKTFFGVGFGNGGVPIDILAIYFLSKFIPDFTLLVVDDFLRLNGVEESRIDSAQKEFMGVMDRLNEVYRGNPEFILCSYFMHTEEYDEIFRSIKKRGDGQGDLAELVLQTVPSKKRDDLRAREYPLHEFACVQYLSDQGFSLKIGPSKEKTYDAIMKRLAIPIDFEYILEAYALGTPSTDSVIHYVPSSRGPNNGQRIFFGDDKQKVTTKLQGGCDEALRYFCKLASLSGYFLGHQHLSSGEIASLQGRALKRQTIELFQENILRPLQ